MAGDISAGKRLLKNEGIITNSASLESVVIGETKEGSVET